MLICIFQGFSSGMPLYVLIQLVPAWLRSEGIDLATIGLFNLVMIPYAWKFIWAPLLDRYKLPFLGRRRGWSLISQLMLLLSISCLGFINPSLELKTAVCLVFATSFFSATQDIVLDAYRREILEDDELGIGNSIFINAYRISSLIPGSFALILSDIMPWASVYPIVGLFMIVGIITTLLVAESANDNISPNSLKEAVIDPFAEFFSRKGGLKSAFSIIAFMLLYKLGDSMATALATPFYIDLGFSLTEIGTVAKFSALWASILGTIIGGLAMLKLSINRALWLFGLVQIISILGFAILAKIGNSIPALFAAVSFEYLGVSLGTVALTAFIAKQTSLSFTATQFALLTSIMVIPRTFANASTGFIIDALGYFNFFIICTIAAIPGMLLLFIVAPWNEKN
ncbi:MAG: AmpG family muropeptide MFS transporter [Gammaproteobacteria bacterium TMED78]|nr:MAG: AmpG family muropeptide MFS transporter [Gammaproteobacteria bacterium TMED78]